MRRKKIGFLGGSFDPLHFGHLNLALSLLEVHHLDTVLFCPTFTSPFKTICPPVASAEYRLAMVHLGIQKIDSFSVLDWEIKALAPSYTIDTVEELKRQTDAELFLLLGEDQLLDLHRWKHAEELLRIAKPLIAARKNEESVVDHLSKPLRSLIERGRTPISMMDISSTIIRKRLSCKQYCGHLVPHLILEYIERHQLYLQ